MDDARRSDGGSVSVSIDPTSLRIESGYLVEVTDDCNCGGSSVDTSHERGCGLWPLMTVDELAGLISGSEPDGVSEVTAHGLTIYGRISNPHIGSEVRVQQSSMDGCARIYGTVHLDVDDARKLRKALDAFIHDVTVRRQSNVSR